MPRSRGRVLTAFSIRMGLPVNDSLQTLLSARPHKRGLRRRCMSAGLFGKSAPDRCDNPSTGLRTMIEITNLTKSYDRNRRTLKDISLTIEDGEFVFITGRSGSGKSTLIRILLKEVEPTSGRVIVNDMDLTRMPRRYVPKYRRRLGVVFQDFRLLKDRNVYENVAFAQRVVGASGRTIRESVPRMLKLVGLSSKYKSFPDQLSGGEQQRVAIARALINRPEVLLADEPTGNLDPQNAAEIMRLLEEINRMGTTVIVVTHSREIVETMRKRVITIERGMIVSDRREGGYDYEN